MKRLTGNPQNIKIKTDGRLCNYECPFTDYDGWDDYPKKERVYCILYDFVRIKNNKRCSRCIQDFGIEEEVKQ